MIIKGLKCYAVLLTPAAGREGAGSTIMNEIEPFLLGTFQTFTGHLIFIPSYCYVE